MLVMAVDDDPSVRDLVRTTLELDGHVVHTAEDGAEALRLVQDLDPDVFVLDVMMPRVNGWQLLAALRNDPRFATTPVLLLTARGLPDDVERGRALGATATMAKPFEVQHLSDMVAAVGVLKR